MNRNLFYYNLLHIGKKDNEQDIILKVQNAIQSQMDMIEKYSSDVEGLCKVAGYNIEEELKNHDMHVKSININEFFSVPEHIFLLVAYSLNDQIKYILVDPTFRQFILQKNRYLNPNFHEWPGEYLKNNNINLYHQLLNGGFSKVEITDLCDYFSCFMNQKVYIDENTIAECMLYGKNK